MEIEDFGKKIGGAKKDLWKERGLSIEDIVDMNDAEKIKFIKKDNIWNKPDYQKLVENGMSIRIAYFIKMIRDALPTKPILRMNSDVEQKQEEYISFVETIRDYVMNIKKEDDILNFYKDFLSRYIIREPYSYIVRVSPEVSSAVDNKLLRAAQVQSLNEIDREIRKKQFCYTEDEKVLSQFEIYLLDNDNIQIKKDEYSRTVIEISLSFGKKFLYPKEEYSNIENWEENTFFVLSKNSRNIVINNMETIEDVEKYLLENFKEKDKARTSKRKGNFKPKPLDNIIRNGENYRNGKNITGNDMLEIFNFRGGEFGNWLNDKDRQDVLNFGYDALLDLSKALNISPTDISLGNNLSIAFGARGSGNALAHYEPLREVINLTKMKGAGSLAHEWGHALDNILGKKLGLKGFMTEQVSIYNTDFKEIVDLINTMKYKTVCDTETRQIQIKEYDKAVNRLKNHINSLFPKEHLSEEQLKLKDDLIQKLIDNCEDISNDLLEYINERKINTALNDLSSLRKETVGKIIPKDERTNIVYIQNSIYGAKNNIGKPAKVKTDFYKNSIAFDEMYSKDTHGYWQSTVEMFARSFACYVQDKLKYRSDYLCGHAELSIGMNLNKEGNLELIKAYPEGEERSLINQKIDKLIEFLKEKKLLHDSKTQELSDELNYEY